MAHQMAKELKGSFRNCRGEAENIPIECTGKGHNDVFYRFVSRVGKTKSESCLKYNHVCSYSVLNLANITSENIPD